METSFSWQNFERMARALQSLGYIVAVLGPIVGIVLLIIGNLALKATGVVVIFGSLLLAVYHVSFALLMDGIRDMTKQLEQVKSTGKA